MLAEFGRADVIHVRCPANISLIATILLCIVHHPRSRWLKYAGNWQPEGEEPRSYTLQRWLLKGRLHGGIVTVNGEWPNQPGHIHHFHNPCLTDHELAEARVSSALKQLSNPIRLLFVGRLETAKGVGRALEIMAELKREGLSATLDLVGDGPERASFENQAKNLEIWHLVRFHGWLPRPLLGPLYAQSHVTLLPTKCSEGWPKILSEAMAYGVVPVSSNVSSIPQYLKIFETGLTFEADDVEGFAGAIALYCSRPERWKEESEKGVRAAHFFGYSHYLNAVRGLLALTTENNGGVSASPPPVDESRKHEAIVE
jgi:glycosyltransferase involved in cell wall biosynthesis